MFADTIIASLLPTGAVSSLYYADRLYQLPVGVIGIAAGTVVLRHHEPPARGRRRSWRSRRAKPRHRVHAGAFRAVLPLRSSSSPTW
jgi:hypothetical protein